MTNWGQPTSFISDSDLDLHGCRTLHLQARSGVKEHCHIAKEKIAKMNDKETTKEEMLWNAPGFQLFSLQSKKIKSFKCHYQVNLSKNPTTIHVMLVFLRLAAIEVGH